MYAANIYQITLFLILLLGVFHGSSASDSFVRRAEEGADGLAPMKKDIADEGIINGFDVENAIPWFVHYNEFGRCGGALVHADIVIVAASCLADGVPSLVRVGSLKPDSDGVLVEVQGAIIHPDYDENNVVGTANIAILKLTSSVTNTIALMNEEPLVPLSFSDDIFVAGLGLTGLSDFASTLQGMFTYYIEDCFAREPDVYNPIFHICVEAGPVSACSGDGGTPAVMAGTRYIVGLIFASNGICDGTSADTNFLVRMSSYVGWVKSTICDISGNPPSNCPKDKDDDEDSGCFLTNIFSSAVSSVSTFWGF